MIVIIPHYKDVVIGAYSDMTRAKRAAKERFPYAFNRVRYVSFEVNDGVAFNVEQQSECPIPTTP